MRRRFSCSTWKENSCCVSCVPRTLLAGLPQFLALGFRLPSEFSVWRVACSGLPLLLLCLLFVRLLKLPVAVASCQLPVAPGCCCFCCSAHAVAAATCHLPFATYLVPHAAFPFLWLPPAGVLCAHLIKATNNHAFIMLLSCIRVRVCV